MKKCPDCGKAFKRSRRSMVRRRAKVGKLPVARHRANTSQRTPAGPKWSCELASATWRLRSSPRSLMKCSWCALRSRGFA